jgi:hypothetical protein
MRQTLILIFFLTFQNAFGQFGLIQDNEGFVNVRKTAMSGNNILDTLANNHIVYCLWPENDYYEVDYEKFQHSHSGFVHSSRVKFLSEFDSIPTKLQTKDKVIFQKDFVKVTITKVPFIIENNKLEYRKEVQSSVLIKINDKEYWGTDGDVPKYQYGQVTIEWGDKIFDLPKESFEDLFEPNFKQSYTTVSFDKGNNTLYIIGENSDGAGAYSILWIIYNGNYKSRHIAHGF